MPIKDELDQIEQVLKNYIPDEAKALHAMIEITPIVYAMLKKELDSTFAKFDEIIKEVLSK